MNNEKERNENARRILAVIPARAGSKGIPNKNIRIICGHPMIYYAISNAKRSKHITDVIVSTDSEEVKIIATQMGVQVRERSKELCGDKVTLDAVIYDAIPDGVNWDYIVTMQPTSPTLLVETLDNAIEYAIDNDLDTLISAINHPHLSWGVENGKTVPNYTERLNRQYLPPCYLETGAFVVSKSDIVTPQSRIGENTDIFEVSAEEAMDIDTFTDLRNAEMALRKDKIGIYVNGNNNRGVGHIYRALELSDEFYVKPDIIYDINQTNPTIFGKTTHNLVGVDGVQGLFEQCKKEQYNLFVNDILSTTYDYMDQLKQVIPNAVIVNFEDDGEGKNRADLVINALLKESKQDHVYSGEKYYIAGKTFMFYKPIEIKDKVERVFISFGGADPQNYSDRILNMITKPEYKDFEFVVVLGRAKKNVDALMEYNKYPNIEVIYNASNMPEIMTSCDVAVTSRGRTGYELAILGIPTLSMAQNEMEEKHGFMCNENGFSYIGLNPSDEIIESSLRLYMNLSQDSRRVFQERLLSHDLRGGRKRVMNLINGLLW